ncbi:hypothetical protein D3C86_1989900 [compost metagenome]
MAQRDGKKSWCRLVITIMSRSIHIPRLATSAIAKSQVGFARTLADHSSWITATLQTITAQNRGA